MAFNLLAVAETPIDWTLVSETYRNTDRMFEMFPIAEPKNGDAIGISIPIKYLNEQSWQSALAFLLALTDLGPLKIYDMYLGNEVDLATYVPDGLRG